MNEDIYCSAGDRGFKFIFPKHSNNNITRTALADEGGLRLQPESSHLVTIAGRGGVGKSYLALQMAYSLCCQNSGYQCFYFSLESTKSELNEQLQTIKNSQLDIDQVSDARLEDAFNRVIIKELPPPIESSLVLSQQINTFVATKLQVGQAPVALFIDTLGGITISDNSRSELGHIRRLAGTYQAFLFLVTEEHLLEKYRDLEHFSQTVIRLSNQNANSPPTSLAVTKCRTQWFRPGLHEMHIRKSERGSNSGRRILIYPSLESVSQAAHTSKRFAENQGEDGEFQFRFTCDEEQLDTDESKLVMRSGSAAFLMGPPGTFKQHLATNFLKSNDSERSLYLSFKVDESKVRESLPDSEMLKVDFLDFRNSLLSPAQMLHQLRESIFKTSNAGQTVTKAVIWGLRRLRDMPNFQNGTDVLFLEAVVTLLKANGITCLLVDWPEPDRANTLPIVDLCQYILLTRACKGKDQISELEKGNTAREGLSEYLWPTNENGVMVRRSVLLRIQRDDSGFHRDTGHLILQKPVSGNTNQEIQVTPVETSFEIKWITGGCAWERDPSLGDLTDIFNVR